MLTDAATAWILATPAGGGNVPPLESSGTSVILPSPAELLFPAVAFALLAALAGFVIWRIVRTVTHDSHDLASQVARLEAENHELRQQLDERRGQPV